MIRLPQWILVALGLLPQIAPAAPTDWRDVESRIQYAWYTEDARDLAAAEHRLADLPGADPLRGYYLILVRLREAQIAAGHGAGAIADLGKAASGCVSSADDTLAVRPTDAEVLALQSLCMDLRSRTGAIGAPFVAARGRSQMQQAQQLSPKDPRVLLMAAQLAYDSARSTLERTRLLNLFQSAVEAFEQERQGLERGPSWGAAEAWQGLAQVQLDRGDTIAARSALEHALLLMPEYRSAHRLLEHILNG